MNMSESFPGQIENVEADPKRERYEIRKRIGELLFELNEVSSRTESAIEVPNAAKKGEAQSEELIANLKQVLDNEDLWASLPDNKEMAHAGLMPIKVNFDRDAVRSELEILLEQHEGAEDTVETE